jgi:hypothetical protein
MKFVLLGFCLYIVFLSQKNYFNNLNNVFNNIFKNKKIDLLTEAIVLNYDFMSHRKCNTCESYVNKFMRALVIVIVE